MTESTTSSLFGTDDLLCDPIVSAHECAEEMSPDDFDVFDFDCMFDPMQDTDGNEMRCRSLTEESIFLLSSPEDMKSKKITRSTRRNNWNIP